MSKEGLRPVVTSVIIAYNNADTIEECLKSVLGQSYPLNETIVVCDQGSKDGTGQKVMDLLEKGGRRFEVMLVPHTGRSAARNAGWKRGRGEVVFFADADDVYNPDYLTRAIQAINDNRIGSVCVTGASLIEGRGLASRMLKLYSMDQVERRARHGFKPSWAWVYTRRALVAVGGFDERLSQAEDKDIFERVSRAGFQVALVEGIHWSHRRPTTNSAYFRKTLLGGSRRVLYLTKYHDYLGFFRSTSIIWLLAAAFVLQTLSPFSLPVASAALLLYLAYRGLATAYHVGSQAPKKDLFTFPFFMLGSHIVSAVGTLFGVLKYAGSSQGSPGRAAGS